MPNMSFKKPVLLTPAFDPRSVLNCKLWLSARNNASLLTSSAPAIDGGVVDTFTDIIGAYGYTQSLAGQKPTYKNGIQNNRSALQFDGSDDYMVAPSGARALTNGIAACTIVVALNVVSLPAGDGNIFNFTNGTTTSSSRVNLTVKNTGARNITGRALDADSNSNFSTAGTFSVGQWEVLIGQWDFTNKQGRILRNGVVEADWTTFTNMTAGNTSATDSQAGNIGNLNSSTYVNVQVGDILLYTSLPSQGSLNYLTRGLGHIWGVPGF